MLIEDRLINSGKIKPVLKIGRKIKHWIKISQPMD